ncbi:MAG: hypothetical protein AB1744_04925 [Candidatus Zixiibacteriota bacterium]
MRRLYVLAVLVLVGSMLAFVAGCDDDGETTGPAKKETGDPNDPIFVQVDSGFSEFSELTPMMLMMSLTFIDSVFSSQPAPGKPLEDPVSAGIASDSFLKTYHSNSQYWYFYLGHWDTIPSGDTTFSMVLEDSIQFLHDTMPVQWPDLASLTGVNVGASFSINVADSATDAQISAGQVASITGDIPRLGDVVITGSGQMSAGATYSDMSDTCSIAFNMSQTISDVYLNLTTIMNDGCPDSGALIHSGQLSIGCTGDTVFSFSDNWTISQTFYGDSTRIVYENSTTRWEYTDTCGPGPAAVWSRVESVLKPR